MNTADHAQGTSPPPLPTPVPLAIIGIGCLFPKADNTEAFWANIKGGVDAVTDIPASHWQADDYFNRDPSAPDMTYARRGAFLEPIDFNPLEFGITPNNLEATDTTQLLGLVVAQQALRDAGYATGRDSDDGRPFNRDRTSVILGVTGALELVVPLGARLGHPIWRKALQEAGVDKPVADDVVRRIADSYVPWQENSFPGLLGNVAAGRIANRFDIGGTNCVVDAACASSLGALHMAAMELYAGRSEMAITGGIDTFNDIFMYMCFSKTPALSPTGASRPFAAGADGTILGEGLGVVVLKRLADAQRDGDRIHAVIRSIGSSSDGKGNAVYAPSPQGQMRCLLSAYSQAGISPQTIELVEAHGTGTKVGDAVEAKALDEVFRAGSQDGTWCALGSVKSMVGHTKAAAGIAGLIKAALALDHKVLPPTIKVDQPLEHVEVGKSALYVNTEKRPWMPRVEHPRRAGVSAFGFGGSNFHCVLEEAQPAKTRIDWDDTVQILAFAAASPEELVASLNAVDTRQSWKQLRTAAARLRASFRVDAPCRLVIVLQKDHADLGKLVRNALQMLGQHSDRSGWSTPDGLYFGTQKRGRLAVLFPGQGSQYTGMLRDLACQFPDMLDTLAEADRAFGVSVHGERLSDHIYPISVFSDAARAQNQKRLSDTRIAQPALGAVSLGAWKVLSHFELQPDAAAGHSFGELVALCVAGRIEEPILHSLACARGRAMADVSAAGDAGAMLAVLAPLAVVQQFLQAESLNLLIANKNAPDQVVLSGVTPDIDRAAKLLETRSIRHRKLPVSAAFHSPLVAAAQKPFGAALNQLFFAPSRMPVWGNTTATVYPADSSQAVAQLVSQLAMPVEFVAQIENMYQAGVRSFLEVGPGGKLSGLVRAILHGRDYDAIALDASSGKRGGVFDLACSLGHLAALGHAVDLSRWDGDFARRPQPPEYKKPAMTVALTGANYVKPRPAAPRAPVAQLAPASTAKAVALHQPAGQQEGLAPLHPNSFTPPESLEAVSPGTRPAATSNGAGLAQALHATQQSILALQKMQEQTAQIHAQYLHGQELAQHTIHKLMEQQMLLLGSAAGIQMPAAIPLPAPAAAPVIFAPASIPAAAPAPATPTIRQPIAVPPAPQQAAALAPSVVAEKPHAPATDDRAEKVLLRVIAEKTGYPVEMLELDMSLDADLGIDSIKRVEILSALQTELPEAPVVKPEDLGRLQTLRQIVAFLSDTPSQELSAHPAPAPTSPVEAASDGVIFERAHQVLLEVVADKTGYPVEMLELDMSLDADLGIDSIKRVEIFSALQTCLAEAPVVKPEDLGRLQTLRQIIAFLSNASPATTAPAEPAQATPKAATPPQAVHGAHSHGPEVLDRHILTVVPLTGEIPRPCLALSPGATVWVTDDGAGLATRICGVLKSRGLDAVVVGLDAQPAQAPLAGLLIVAPHHPPQNFIQEAFTLMQRVGPMLRAAGSRSAAFLASASSMDGQFGLNGHTPRNPLVGGLAGLVKTASHEWPEVSCKSLDIALDLQDADHLASQIADELLIKGPAEVGISKNGRCETRLVRKALNGEVGKASLTRDDVVVVTGGARGVTAAVSIAVAKAYGSKLLLLGRSPAPGAEPEWLAPLVEESQIKKALATRMEGATPRSLEEQYRRVMADREVRNTLESIRATGSQVIYKSLDVRDTDAVAAVIADVRKNVGPIRGIIHGAGVLQDRLIEHKTPAQFEDVFSTKVGGFNALLHAVQQDDIRVIVAFSSTTGRFGRRGQIAYAAANEVLNKLAQQEAHQRPGCRVLSMNWGPWEGGMVTPQLRRIFENEGVGLIPLQAGADYLVREMSTPAGGPVEILILGPEPKGSGKGPADAPVDPAMTLAFERTVDVASHPVLRSHVIKGKAVLPAALIIEWLAHAAMHENPGLAFHGFEDLRILKGVTIDGKESVTIQVLTGSPISRDGFEWVPTELRAGSVVRARASILLTSHLPAGIPGAVPAAHLPYSAGEDGAYADGRLFHGAALQGIRSIQGWSEEGLIARAAAAPAAGEWLQRALRSTWLADPMALDAAFQLMILWCFEARGVGSLPTGIDRYRQFVRSFPQAGTRIQVRVSHVAEHSATGTIEFLDGAGGLVARMEGYQCVLDATLEESFALNQLAD